MNVQCVKETDHLLTYDTAWVAGYKCTSIELYFIILGVAVLLQVGRNFIWTKTSQATREALHEPVEGDGCFGACCSCGSSRMKYIRKLLFYTLLSMIMYIVNILLILGANLGILSAVLVGNLIGTWLSVSMQKQDKSRTSIELKTMIDDYNYLKNNEKLYGPDSLSEEDVKHMVNIEDTRSAMQRFLMDTNMSKSINYSTYRRVDNKMKY